MTKLPQAWAEAPIVEVVKLHDDRRVPLNATQRSAMKGP
jgi:hypothetical protein